ncbi:i-AAA protease yme1 [Elasticomyces elasticus]|nr:i-AAA protease yme1 [Elasticomyces elasticus]
MAVQAPASLQSIASTTRELWPSMSAVLATPWRQVARRTPPVQTRTQQAVPTRNEVRNTLVAEEGARVPLPEALATVPLSALHFRPSPEALSAQYSTASLLGYVPRNSIRRCSPLARSLPSFQPTSRSFSTFSRFGISRPLVPRPGILGLTQQRTLFGASTSQNLLAHMEQTANNNPQSATAQNALYSALLRANLPEILVERYNTGRYATSPACEQLYARAVERIGAAETGAANGFGAANSTAKSSNGQHGGMSNEQLQAVGQAAAARTFGGNASISRAGSGARNEPLYVMVEESKASIVFRWVKFLLVFGLVCYFSLVIFTLVIEFTGVIKKAAGSQNQEVKPELQTTKFADVHGCDEAKEELQELVEFLKSPDKFSTLGGKLPKGVLLSGPPGTGKTLLARAVAGEAGVPFFYMSGSEFDEVYVGVGAKRVRDLFNAARAKAPAIVFIDELDAIGSKRNERDAAYAKQTLNQLLTELDGFEQNSGVVIIGATNFPQSLDKALTRPGRFDRNVIVDLPDVRGRIAILKHHLRNIRIDGAVDPAVVARGCPGFSGAELENLVNQAAVRASKMKAKKVGMDDLVWAKDKILMGAESRSKVIQPKDKLATAYHEGGHALVAMFSPHADPLYKATIMPRGHALGITFQLPELDKVSTTKCELEAAIDVCMGGKVAEELIYGAQNVSTGASSDIQAATRYAYMMVTQAGMSELLGNIDLASDYNKLSPATKDKIETEVRRMVDEGYQRAKKMLSERRDGLERLARALVEYETLGKEEMEAVVRGERLPDRIKIAPDAPVKVPELLPGFAGFGAAGGAAGSPAPPPSFPGAPGGGGESGQQGGSPSPPAPYPAGSP